MSSTLAPNVTLAVDSTDPAMRLELTDERFNDWTLAECDVTFTMWKPGEAPKVDGEPCVIVTSDPPVVEYRWRAGDTDTAGTYLGRIAVTFPSSKVGHFPNGTEIVIVIRHASTPTNQLVSTDDVNGMMNWKLGADVLAFVPDVIEYVERDAERLLGYGLSPSAVVETHLMQPGSDMVYLNRGPVATVSSVTIGGDALTADGYEVTRWGIRVLNPPLEPKNVVVSFTGGLDAVVGERLKLTILGRIVRMVAKRADESIGSESVDQEGYTVRWMSEQWTNEEKAALDGARRLRVAIGGDPSPHDAGLFDWRT